MKLKQLKLIIKEAVKEAIQEEIKDILLEAVKVPKSIVQEKLTPIKHKPLPEKDKMALRENMMNVLNGMMPGADRTLSATTADIPLQVNGPVDTTSANGTLPTGTVSIDQIVGLMKGKG